jgi:hypothetical protein
LLIPEAARFAVSEPKYSEQVCYAVARPRLEAKTFRAVVPLAVVNVLNLVCGLIGKMSSQRLSML